MENNKNDKNIYKITDNNLKTEIIKLKVFKY